MNNTRFTRNSINSCYFTRNNIWLTWNHLRSNILLTYYHGIVILYIYLDLDVAKWDIDAKWDIGCNVE